ncbi:MAG: polysaccharide biosynthesis/export family protein [Planctomycetota bacterium]
MFRFASLALPLVLATCASPIVEDGIPVSEIDPKRWPQTRYTILPGDELEVRFFDTPELDVVAPVRPDGRIALPLLQGILASGKTPELLASEIEIHTASELRDPRVTVIVRSFAGRRFHVGGEVGDPGVFVLDSPTTVLEAVLQAGGLLDTAHTRQVIVLRPVGARPALTVSGPPPAPAAVVDVRGSAASQELQPYAALLVDLGAVLNGSDTAQNIELRPYDAVYVPRSPIANLNRWVDQYIRQNIPVNVALRPEINN